MRRLRRLASLTEGERRLLFRAYLVTAVSRAALWVLPLGVTRRIVARTAGSTVLMPVERFVWAVKVASRYVPRSTCLTQAIAAQALLACAGHESCLEIGVTKDAEERFEAHAWVICNNEIVIGGPEVARYARLTTWQL